MRRRAKGLHANHAKFLTRWVQRIQDPDDDPHNKQDACRWLQLIQQHGFEQPANDPLP